MTPEEILAGAANILEQKGWLQCAWEDYDGRCCLLGALAKAGCLQSDEGKKHWCRLKHAVAQEVGVPDEGPGGHYDSLIDWNNEPGRTKEEVITALRNAKRWL
jgi:hypothetical protein